MSRSRLGYTLATLALFGCEDRSRAHAALDRAPPDPVPLPTEPAKQGPDQAEPSGGRGEEVPASECGRGTGKTPQGECVPLRVHDAGYAQRVQIPAGTFVMGDVPESYDGIREQPVIRWSGQPPRHVEVDSFWIDLHEVPRGAYEQCVQQGRCSPARCLTGEDPAAAYSRAVAEHLPRTCVTHAQAEAFCRAHGGRLPTEAEWEYAARGVDARRYPWGNEFRDEIGSDLLAVGQAGEPSYFGILDFGANAMEWVADPYRPEGPLLTFVDGEFRDPDGPLATTRRTFERRLACGPSPEPGCEVPPAPRRFVIKFARAGARKAGRPRMPAHPPDAELEGWPVYVSHPRVGFRCAADLSPDQSPLQVPATPPAVPLVREAGALQIFGGVAEAASRGEAQAFCARLRVPAEGRVLRDFRLPSAEEVANAAAQFRGPGPFWTDEGAVVQGQGGPEAAWEPIAVEPGTALLARCVRG